MPTPERQADKEGIQAAMEWVSRFFPRSTRRGSLGEYLRGIDHLFSTAARIDPLLRSRYALRYLEAYSRIESVMDSAAVLTLAAKAPCILMGDFHALPEYRLSQRGILEAIHALNPLLVLLVECFTGRDQPHLDRWIRGEITDADLLRRTRWEKAWGFPWEGFRPLMESARQLKIPLLGLDSPLRGDIRLVRARDQLMAQRIAAAAERFPGHCPVAVVGESHLAPPHLPSRVSQELKAVPLILLFNHETLYGKLLQAGLKNARAAQAAPGVFCFFSLNPALKYDYYLGFLEIQDISGKDPSAHAARMFAELSSRLWRWISPRRSGRSSLEVADALPDIYGDGEVEEYLASRNRQHPDPVRQALTRALLRYQGVHLDPEGPALLVTDFNLPMGAQEAGRFLFRFQGKGRLGGDWAGSLDLFYLGVLEYTAGYLASKRLYPLRNHFAESVFLRLESYPLAALLSELPLTRSELYGIARFLKEHKEFESGFGSYTQPPLRVVKGVLASPAISLFLQRELGFTLGEQLFRACTEDIRLAKRPLVLFSAPLDRPGAPLELYLDLALESAPHFRWKGVRHHPKRGFGPGGIAPI